MSNAQRIMIKNVRCLYPKLFVPEEYQGVKRYSIQLPIEAGSENEKKLMKAIHDAVENRFPGKSDAMIKRFKSSKTTWPIRDNEDGIYIQPKRKEVNGAPAVVDQRKVDLPKSSGLPFGGCWVNCSVDVFCYSNNGGGVTTYLNGVQLVREDSPLSGAPSARACKDDFDVIEGADDNVAEGEDFPF